ncbi:gamma carbonic anhydrase family protein [Hydrogenoanaerobacterium sp.]|uniref:gamma carbonic anhydrase family protein n=1 Tax=Hydrogenoanaerobacterium sp. TaxID=2953763 RepID=UPI0028981644|nr:gamma carbonic anhydrase family protein [Hydrogenoanaerobacterium sp.]
MKKPTIDESSLILQGAVVTGDVTIGRGCSVWYNAVLRGDIAPIVVGEGSNVQDCSVLHVDHSNPIIVGKGVTIGHGAILHGCEIGDNSLIGMGAIVLNGVKIGKDCMVGAGALVTQGTQVPDGSLILGNPAKVKRPLTQEEIEHNKTNAAEYLHLIPQYKQDML